MSRITQPINQVRFTNVAIVRMNKNGKRFEIACYRNKITNYRQGVETDISEVLQTERIFTNVSKGQEAKSSDLEDAFGTSTDMTLVCHTILTKGEYQVSDLERIASFKNRYKEIATMIQEKCVNKETNRRYTISVISEAMKKSEFSVHPTRSTKQQFLDVVKMIQKKKVLPNLERAKMLLCISASSTSSSSSSDKDNNRLNEIMTQFKNIEANHIIEYPKIESHRVEMLIDPSLFRHVEKIVKDHQSGQYFLEILQQVVAHEQDCTIEQELDYNTTNKAISKDIEQQQQQQQQNAFANLSIQEKTTSTTSKASHIETLAEDVSKTKNSKIHQEQDEQQHNEDENNEEIPIISNNKQNKKAMKKSKKAKRREKAGEADRQQRIDVEKQRQEERNEKIQNTTNVMDGDGNITTITNKKSCNTCGGSFTPNEYRIHFKSDWHRFNLTLKMKGVTLVSEEEFLMCDANILFD